MLCYKGFLPPPLLSPPFSTPFPLTTFTQDISSSKSQPSGFIKFHSKTLITKKHSLRLAQLSTPPLLFILFLHFFVLRCWFWLQGASWFSRKKIVWMYPSPMLVPLWRFSNVTAWAAIRNGNTTRKAWVCTQQHSCVTLVWRKFSEWSRVNTSSDFRYLLALACIFLAQNRWYKEAITFEGRNVNNLCSLLNQAFLP